MPASNQPAATPAGNSSVNRLIALIFAVVLGFAALCALILVDARNGTFDRAAAAAASLASSIESEAARTVETADLSLQTVIENLNDPVITRLDLQTRRRLTFNRAVPVQRQGSVIVVDRNGDVTLDSRIADAGNLNVADRDYFQAHRDNANLGLYIAKPIISRISGLPIFGASRRLSNADGSFAGIVMVSIQLSYFQQLFQQSVPGPNGSITLSTGDGVMLMRWPYKAAYIGSDFRHSKLYDHLALSQSGRFESNSAIDGEHRLTVYRQVDDLPLVVAVSQSTADIYADWRAQTVNIVLLLALLTVTILLLAGYLIRELNRRRNVEADLALLAMTDSLTGLANRRRFSEALDIEWARAAREGTALSLMMLDADKFKPYNDMFGHQAGDALLKAIGLAIGSAIADASPRGTLGVRYGGDEFALLLPRTGADAARQIETGIRHRFIHLCQQTGIVPCGLSTGISCMTPSEGETPHHLIEIADKALYDAKRRGHNRVDTAPIVTTPDITLTPPADRSSNAA